MSKQKAIAPGAWRRYQAVSASAADMIAEAATGNTYGVNCQCISLPLSCRICVCQIKFQSRAGQLQGITYSHQRKQLGPRPTPKVDREGQPYYTTKRPPFSMHCSCHSQTKSFRHKALEIQGTLGMHARIHFIILFNLRHSFNGSRYIVQWLYITRLASRQGIHIVDAKDNVQKRYPKLRNCWLTRQSR